MKIKSSFWCIEKGSSVDTTKLLHLWTFVSIKLQTFLLVFYILLIVKKNSLLVPFGGELGVMMTPAPFEKLELPYRPLQLRKLVFCACHQSHASYIGYLGHLEN